MNTTTTKILATLGILTATGLGIVSAGAADLNRATLTAPIGVGAAGAAQQVIKDNSSLLLTPTPTPIPVGVNPAAVTAPVVKKVLTPGSAQQLNPQPLPPKSSGFKQLTPGVNQSLNPQPLPPKAGAQATLQPAVNAKNLFNTSDTAIIIVSGKPTTAGNLKREIKADLKRIAGPPTIFRTLSNKSSIGSPKKTAIAAEGKRAGLVSLKSGTSDVVTKVGKPGSSISQVLNYCKDHPPEITGIKGHFVSGESVTIQGLCFGDTTGAVEIIGQFPGGKLQPSFSQWSDGSIVAVLPSVRGVPDGAVAVTVVRAPDHARSPAKQATFTAARERIEVPASLWSPNGVVDKTDVKQGGGNIFSGFTVWGVGGSLDAKFNLKVNPQCTLDNLEIPTTVGRVNSVSGFDAGPLNEAAINVNFVPTCTTKTINYVVASESTTWCQIAFQLHTWAYCPAGLTP